MSSAVVGHCPGRQAGLVRAALSCIVLKRPSRSRSEHCKRRAACTCARASAEAVEAGPTSAAAAPPAASETEREIRPGVFEGYWTWHDSTGSHRIRYQRSGDAGPPLLCVHGFGGNADQWRHQLRALGAAGCRVWAVDLLGYGYSDKPDPRARPPNEIYNFHTWSRQLLDFRSAHIGEPAFVITNSVGGITGLQAALDAPSQVRGVQVMNVSLRMLHASKQPAWQRPAVATLQRCLRETALGPWFFSQIATRNGVRSVLRQCYARPEAVTDELVDIILNPGLQAGAVDVFLDFLSYSSGPLPEQQLAEVAVPVSVLWGEEDPWEKLEWGRAFAPGPRFPAIEEFVPLPGVGHCPQCEAPELVNPLILAFVQRHAA